MLHIRQICGLFSNAEMSQALGLACQIEDQVDNPPKSNGKCEPSAQQIGLVLARQLVGQLFFEHLLDTNQQ